MKKHLGKFIISCVMVLLSNSAVASSRFACSKIQTYRWDLLAMGQSKMDQLVHGYYRNTGQSIDVWGDLFRIKSSSRRSLWRGMFLTPQQLESILSNGLDAKQSKGGVLYFTKDPLEALDYARDTWSGQGSGRLLRVVLEVVVPDRLISFDASMFSQDHRIVTRTITRQQIKKIYILSTEANPEFPFIEI